MLIGSASSIFKFALITESLWIYIYIYTHQLRNAVDGGSRNSSIYLTAWHDAMKSTRCAILHFEVKGTRIENRSELLGGRLLLERVELNGIVPGVPSRGTNVEKLMLSYINLHVFKSWGEHRFHIYI